MDIKDYYSRGNLRKRIEDAIQEAGLSLQGLRPEHLSSVDEFHTRGEAATEELIAFSGFDSAMHILDAGCGVGGPARHLARQGCRVTGIDLSPDFIEAAKAISVWLNSQLVDFHCADVLAVPFEEQSFHGAWSIQMGMNIADKAALLQEIHRILKPGGCYVCYEIFAGETEACYPTPWAQTADMSYLIEFDNFSRLALEQGFHLEQAEDLSPGALASFEKMQAPKGDEKLPPLGVHLLVGEDILHKAFNVKQNFQNGSIKLFRARFRK